MSTLTRRWTNTIRHLPADMLQSWRGTLALLVRSLRQDAFSTRMHLLRGATVVTIFLFLYIAHRADSVTGAPGQMLFVPLSYMNFALITLAGTSYFATPITEEKDEMTLGLLRMAGVSPLALLFGKSTSRMLGVMLIFIAQLPFALLTIPLGGITLNQVIASYVCLFAYMLWLANWGLFCSVICSTSRRAGAMATTGILLLLFAPQILQAVANMLSYAGLVDLQSNAAQSVNDFCLWLSGISPFTRIMTIQSSAFTASPWSTQVIVNSAAAGGFFAVAWATFDRFNREERPATPLRWGLPFRSSATAKSRPPRFRAGENALLRKDFYFVAGGVRMWVVKACVYALITGALMAVHISDGGQLRSEDLGRLAITLSLGGICVETSLMASRVFRDEKRDKTFPSLYMLPMTLGQLAYEKIGGCLIGLLPACLLFLFGSIIAPHIFFELVKDTLTEPWAWVFIVQFVLFLHLVVWGSLQIKWGALPLAIAIVLFTNFIFQVLTFTLVLLAIPSGAGPAEGMFRYVLPVFFTGGEIAIIALLKTAIAKQLRQTAGV